MQSTKQQRDSKRTYKRGLLFNDKGMVVAIDPYNNGVAKYQNKSTNYEALRYVNKNRL